jgi:hypothetical protein
MNRRNLFKGGLLAGTGGLLAKVSTGDALAAVPESSIWTSYYAKTRVWGYVNKHSVTPGTPFNLMLSTGPWLEKADGHFEIFRIGHGAKDGLDRELVFRSDPVQVESEPVQMTACAIGPAWPVAYDRLSTDGWRPGYYTIDFVNKPDDWRDHNIACIVVTDPNRSGDILVWLSTNTYQAYNEWGGGSFYTSTLTGNRAQMVSFDRPTAPDFFEFEYFLVTWLERLAAEQGLKIGYTTNFDMYRDPDFSGGYKLLISGCHNEYWSKQEFDQVYQRIFNAGKNTLFFGANTAYWQVRYADIDRPPGAPEEGRQLVCYKSSADPIRQRVDESEGLQLATMLFRDFERRPETMLAGVAYQSYFPSPAATRVAYTVVDASLPFFAGTDYKPGDKTPDIVGYEWDCRDPDADGRRLWAQGRSQIVQIDNGAIKVLFAATPVDLKGVPGKAEAVYFESPAGAKVFSTGSIRWAWGLGKPGFEDGAFKTLNRNLVLFLLGK